MNSFTDEFQQVLDDVQSNDEHFKELDLQWKKLGINCFDEEDAGSKNMLNHYLDALSDALLENNIIEEVNIDYDFIRIQNEVCISILFHAIGSLCSLKHINIFCKNSILPISSINVLVSSATNLESLSLYSANLSGSRWEFESFNKSLRGLLLASLRKLMLFQVKLPEGFTLDQSFQRLNTKRLKLEELKITCQQGGLESNDVISSESLRSVLKLSSLKILTLNGMKMDHDRISAIAELIKLNIPLESLDVRYTCLNDEDFSVLISSLSSNKNLHELIVADNQLACNSGKSLGRVLIKNSTLKILNINNNNIGDEGGRELGRCLYYNKTLEKLQLDDCNIGDDGIREIAGSLNMNQICDVHLKRNKRVTKKGHELLAKAVRKNLSYQTLNLMPTPTKKVAVLARTA